ncbi:Kinase superfamily protein [Hibiscus syriacus]|uniref:Kinase superfamily protein n=2 Tax=Hibiscus syriacus TaxID=106335 RepID=A0A6A2ZKJ4_HIBSY|nr:Kinase superfamily protein [Hibiscus syriacus]
MQADNVIEIEGTDTHKLRFSPVLRPSRDSVNQALRHINPDSTLTRLVSTYFEHGESITTLCLMLLQCVSRARALYAPVSDLLHEFPSDLSSIRLSHCNSALGVFVRFDSLDNPFPSPDSHNFNEIHRGFCQLNEQLDHHRNKYLSRLRLLNSATTGSAICLIGSVIGVVISAVVISTHALAAIVGLVATPFCPCGVPSSLKKKQLAHMAQLYGATGSGTFFHINYLESIVCLVDLLHSAVKDDRNLIRIALKSGADIYPVYEVVKYLRNNHNKFFGKLKELEDHIYFCLDAVNKSRANLLDQIQLHQSSNS